MTDPLSSSATGSPPVSPVDATRDTTLPWYSLRHARRSHALELDRVIASMTITARCRLRASVRLKRLGSYHFHTATISSLCLILIPLLQLANVQLPFRTEVLSMAQVFVAVVVLVYSVISSTARYDVRAERLSDCGDRIKALIREVRGKIDQAKSGQDLVAVNQRYTDIISDSENHSESDYFFAVRTSPEYFDVPIAARWFEAIKMVLQNCGGYLPMAIAVLLQVVLVLDLFGMTALLTTLLK